MGDGVEEEDRRREAALAASPLLQPGFESSNVSQALLDKFRELHERRLQMKERPKDKRKSKVNANGNMKGRRKKLDIKECKENEATTAATSQDSNISIAKESTSLMNPDEVAHVLTPKKRQKLYWGLDTKERWERKSNM